MEAEEAGKVLLEYAPDSQMAEEYRKLADQILAVCAERRDHVKTGRTSGG